MKKCVSSVITLFISALLLSSCAAENSGVPVTVAPEATTTTIAEATPVETSTETTTTQATSTSVKTSSTTAKTSAVTKKPTTTKEILCVHGHQWGDWKINIKPTVKKRGVKTRKCSICGSSVSLEIPKLFYDKIGVYKTENVKREELDDWQAVASVYVCDDNDKTAETKLKAEFKKAFGFAPFEEVTKEFLGIYTITGCDEKVGVYLYQIADATYPLIDNEMNTVYHQICDDGSPWVGFCIQCNMDDHAAVSKTKWYLQLEEQMLKEFEEITGKSVAEMRKDKKHYEINIISEVPMARTIDGELMEVLYIFCRGIAE